MERRERQKLDRSKLTQRGHRAAEAGNESMLCKQLQTDSWLRIGLAAKDWDVRFNNLFSHLTVGNLEQAFKALEGSKAVGIDGITKKEYAKNLKANLEELVTRLHKGTYRPMPKRRVFIPKGSGKLRPIAISSFEDKMVEWVTAKILGSIYEPMFIRNSFGFRPKRSAHDAIKATYLTLKDDKRPYVVEIDLANFFDSVRHRKLIKLLGMRIVDKRFLSLISRFLNAGILEQTGISLSEVGTPQGSIMSPVLANVFLHYAVDEWFLKNYASKQKVVVRYADDAIFIFDLKHEAENFERALKTRLNKYHLTLNEEKSGIIRFGKNRGNVFHFLGFTFYWAKEFASTRILLRVKTAKTTLLKKIQTFQDWIKEERSRHKLDDIWRMTAAKLRGHYNYYGVCTNRPKLNHFYHAVIGGLFKWLNRRSQRKSFNWVQFAHRLRQYPLPLPPPVAVLHQFVDRRRYAH